MKNMKWFITLFLGVLISGCASQSPFKYGATEVSAAMLDSLSENRLSTYTETVEDAYLFGCIRLWTSGSGSERATISQELRSTISDKKNFKEPLYDERMRRLLLNSEISTDVTSKCLGIYKRRKSTIQGIMVNFLSKNEVSELVENMK